MASRYFRSRSGPWDLGPVVGEVWHANRDGALTGDPANLSDAARETLDAVLAWYGGHSEDWLSELTHRELPWANADVRGARPSPIITHEALRAFYGATPREAGKTIPLAYLRGATLVMRLTPEELADLADDEAAPLTPEEMLALAPT